MSNSDRFLLSVAGPVALKLRDALAGACDRIEFAGSLRRLGEDIAAEPLQWIAAILLFNVTLFALFGICATPLGFWIMMFSVLAWLAEGMWRK